MTHAEAEHAIRNVWGDRQDARDAGFRLVVNDGRAVMLATSIDYHVRLYNESADWVQVLEFEQGWDADRLRREFNLLCDEAIKVKR